MVLGRRKGRFVWQAVTAVWGWGVGAAGHRAGAVREARRLLVSGASRKGKKKTIRRPSASTFSIIEAHHPPPPSLSKLPRPDPNRRKAKEGISPRPHLSAHPTVLAVAAPCLLTRPRCSSLLSPLLCARRPRHDISTFLSRINFRTRCSLCKGNVVRNKQARRPRQQRRRRRWRRATATALQFEGRVELALLGFSFLCTRGGSSSVPPQRRVGGHGHL